MVDPKITRDKFIEYVAPLVSSGKPSEVIAQACKATKYGRFIQGRNLFKKEWTEDCGYPYVEINKRIWDGFNYRIVKVKIRKYRSWEESIADHEINGDDLRGIITLYDLTKYDV